MKLNIKKLQLGGVIYGPSDLEGAKAPAATSAASAKQEKDPIESYMKEVNSQLIGKGLINEVNLFSESYQKDLRAYESLPESVKNSYQGQVLRRKLQGDFGKLNELVQNQNVWNKSYDTMKSRNTQATAATIGNNFVVKTTDGKVSTVSFDKYNKENDGKDYKVLTIAELLDERNRNPNLAFDTETMEIAQSSYSPEEYAKIISDFASKASGSNTEQLISEGYLTAAEAKALKTVSGNIESGVFKTAKEVVDNTNKDQLDLTLKAAIRNIGPVGLNTLKAKFLQEGVQKEELDGKIEEYLVSLTYPKLTTKRTERDKIAFDSAATKSTGLGGGGSDKVANLGAYELAAVGRANKDDFMTISKNLSMHAPMFRLPEEAIKRNNKAVLLSESDAQNVGYMDKITTADGKKVDPTHTTMKNLYYTELPMIKSGDTYKLDVEGGKKVSQYNEALKNAGLADKPIVNMTPTEKVQLNNLKAKYDFNKWEGKLMRVLVGEATSYDTEAWYSFTSDRSDSPYYSKPTSEDRAQLENLVVNGTGARIRLDNPMYSHLVIIPAKDQSAFRFADSEKLRVSREDVMMGDYTSAPGSSLHGETSIRELAQNPTLDYGYSTLNY